MLNIERAASGTWCECPNWDGGHQQGCQLRVKFPRDGGPYAKAGLSRKEMRVELIKRDGPDCQYCGGPGHTFDHVVPIAHGGGTRLKNLVLACKPCNGEKADKLHWRG